LIYATIAATLGVFVAQFLEPIAPFLKIASFAVLMALGIRGIYGAWRSRKNKDSDDVKGIRGTLLKTYFSLLGLTILNPATIAYFAALILGGTVGTTPNAQERVAFIAGAFLSSWSWQSFIAAIGALAHRHLPPGFRVWTSVVGNAIVIGLGVAILF
jgi:arginine exporter protein ArgO